MIANNAQSTKHVPAFSTDNKEGRRSEQMQKKVQQRSLVVAIVSTLLLRIAGRTSFVLLSFYLGEHFTSTATIALILESFYITELLISPLVGSLSDQIGYRPFLVLTPIVAAAATTCMLLAAQLLHKPNFHVININLIILLFIVLFGRLLEGAASGMSVPATLGYITDATAGSDRLRARAMTAFEIATVGGIALAIPLGGRISSLLGTWGFLIVIGMYLFVLLLVNLGLKECAPRQSHEQRGSLLAGLTMIRQKRIFTFLPAWFSVNALVGSWTLLILIMLSYPNPAADARYPHQLLYGGFSKMSASLWAGLFSLIFLLGMGLWMPLLSRMRRTTIMLISLGGLTLMILALTYLNGLADNPQSLSISTRPLALSLVFLTIPGVLLLSGFTPVALTQMSALAERQPLQRGAVMGLYSVVLALGQLLGSVLGGFFVDRAGFYGLMIFSLLMGLISLCSVLYVRTRGHDLPAVVSQNI